MYVTKGPSLPEPRVVKFSTLMYDISEGKIKIPQFQRYFVWSMKESARLLDSILKGYPIGTFIMWNTDERLHAVRDIGSIKLPEPNENEYVNFVLDGQQRITSIFAALNGETIELKDGKKEEFSDIVVDLDAKLDEDIITTKQDADKSHTTIQLTTLLYGGLFELSKFDQKYHEKLDDYKEKINAYNYSVIQVSHATIDVAAEIFERTNVGGKRLDTFQIMVAKTYDHASGFDLAEKSDELVEKLRAVKYDTLPKHTALHLISLILKGEVKRKAMLSLQKDDVKGKWEYAVNAIQEAVDYLRSYYRIPVSRLLPYDSLVVLIAYFFYKNHGKPPNVNQAKYLDDLFWRVSLTGRYAGSSDTKIAQDAKHVNKIIDGQRPEYDWPINISVKRSGEFKVGGAFSKAIICIYAYYEPKSFKNDAKVSIDNNWLKRTSSMNYHHFFPKSYLKVKGVADQEINNVLNITLVDDYLNKQEIRGRAPSDYMKEFSKKNKRLSQTMKTHLINDLDEFGVWSDDYQTFLNKRALAVDDAIKKRIILKEGESVMSNTTELEQNTSDKPLHTIKYVRGMKCPISIICSGRQAPIQSWVDVLYEVAAYLVKNRHLNNSHCPIPIGKENMLLHTKSTHQNGKPFSTYRRVGELYLNTNLSPTNALKHAIKLIKLAKRDQNYFKLIFSNPNINNSASSVWPVWARESFKLEDSEVAYTCDTDPSLTLPMTEMPNQEFKSSFKHDYKAEYFRQNKKALGAHIEKLVKSTDGKGLQYEVAKSIVGMANSEHDAGRIWVGVGDPESGGKPKLLGLSKDFKKNYNKEEIRRRIQNWLSNCIRDYPLVDSDIDIRFPKMQGVEVCLITVRKRNSASHTINGKFWLRDMNAPRTTEPNSSVLLAYTKKRFQN